MSLTIFDREAIKTALEPYKVPFKEMENYIPEYVYEFMKRKGHLRTIQDRIVWGNRTKNVPYDRVEITKFLTPEFDVSAVITEMVGELTAPFLFYLDFHFLFLGKNDDDEDEFFKFQTASKASAMNDTFKITDENDYNELVAELKDKNFSDYLNECAQNHIDLYDYNESGLRPYQLFSMVVYIQKFPDF